MTCLFESTVCDYHKRYPGTLYAGCTCADFVPEHHARATDPSTSHEAALALKPTAQQKMKLALDTLKAHPGSTAAELEDSIGVSDGRIRKRLTDLRDKGLAHTSGKRKCRVTGRKAQVWYEGKDYTCKRCSGKGKIRTVREGATPEQKLVDEIYGRTGVRECADCGGTGKKTT